MRKSTSKSYEYIEKLMTVESNLMFQARANSEKLGLDGISLSTVEARIMQFHLESIKAEKVVEIGTLTGLSALHILKVLPAAGQLWTLEKSEEHASLAIEVLQDEITKKRCHILVGDARETMNQLVSEAPFDAIFIDGNKAAYLDYFNWAVQNIRQGGLIIVDNIFLAGAVWGDETKQRFNEKQIRVVQEMNKKAFSESNLSSVVIPTEEGMLICRKQS